MSKTADIPCYFISIPTWNGADSAQSSHLVAQACTSGVDSTTNLSQPPSSEKLCLTMEKLRAYIAATSSSKPGYSKLTQSAADEHVAFCPHCGHDWHDAPQISPSSIKKAWLAVWTIATLFLGVLTIFILLLAKQYTLSLTAGSSCSPSTSLSSDEIFSESMLKAGGRCCTRM